MKQGGFYRAICWKPTRWDLPLENMINYGSYGPVDFDLGIQHKQSESESPSLRRKHGIQLASKEKLNSRNLRYFCTQIDHHYHKDILTTIHPKMATVIDIAPAGDLVVGLGHDSTRRLVRVSTAILQIVSPVFNVLLGPLVGTQQNARELVLTAASSRRATRSTTQQILSSFLKMTQ